MSKHICKSWFASINESNLKHNSVQYVCSISVIINKTEQCSVSKSQTFCRCEQWGAWTSADADPSFLPVRKELGEGGGLQTGSRQGVGSHLRRLFHKAHPQLLLVLVGQLLQTNGCWETRRPPTHNHHVGLVCKPLHLHPYTTHPTGEKHSGSNQSWTFSPTTAKPEEHPSQIIRRKLLHLHHHNTIPSKTKTRVALIWRRTSNLLLITNNSQNFILAHLKVEQAD